MPPIPAADAMKLREDLLRCEMPSGALALVLGLDDRTVRQWMSGKRDIPAHVGPILEALVRFRLQALERRATPPT